LPCPQMHVASSRSLKRLRYAIVLPRPVSIAAKFEVRLIFILSLSCTVGKHCFVVAALVHAVHSSCHFLPGFFCCFVIHGAHGNSVESDAGAVASSCLLSKSIGQFVAVDSYLGLNPREFHLPFIAVSPGYLFLITSTRQAWLLTLRSESRATLLSVNIVALCGLITLLCSDSIASRTLNMTSCSAWLLEHLLSSFSFIWATISLRYEDSCA